MFLKTIFYSIAYTENRHFNKRSVEWIINLLNDKRKAERSRKDYYIKYYHALKLISQAMYTSSKVFQT